MNIRRWALILACMMTTSVFAKTFFLAENTVQEDKPKEKDKSYHVFADVDLVPTQEVEYAKPRVVVKALVPKLVTESDDENITDFNQRIEDLLAMEAEDFKSRVNQLSDVQKNLSKKTIKNNLNVDFNSAIVNTGESPLVSIRFTFEGYISGMAHPYHYHRVFNYDLETGTELELANLFLPESNYLQIISDYARNMLVRKLKPENASMVASGTLPTPENYRNWNIESTGIRFTFDETTVAPYIYGTQSVIVPYQLLDELLAEDTPLTNCLQHKKRCFRNNLRTGGFIEEAAITKKNKTVIVAAQS